MLSPLTRSEEVGHSRVGELRNLMMRTLDPPTSQLCHSQGVRSVSTEATIWLPQLQKFNPHTAMSQSKKCGGDGQHLPVHLPYHFPIILLAPRSNWNWVPAPTSRFARGKGGGPA